MSLARDLWLRLEAVHAPVYFAPEAREEYGAAGLKGGWMGYFASRAAPLGPVPAEVVVATFYNFHPAMVRRAIPDAWTFSSPEQVLEARHRAARRVMERLDVAGAPGLEDAAKLAAEAARAADAVGRPLFAAHAALQWSEDPAMVLWHAATLLREHRGDGHVATLLAEQIDGCEAHVLVAAAGLIDAAAQRSFRGWSEEEWADAAGRLRARGLLDDADKLTPLGVELRERIEQRTNELAMQPYRASGEAGAQRLLYLLEPIVQRIKVAAAIPYPNPMGLPER